MLSYKYKILSVCTLVICELSIGRLCGLGRFPEKIDHQLCRVQMFTKLDQIQDLEDPKASVEAYFNRTGYTCKTYCRIKSTNKELTKISAVFDSPYYLMCAHERYCGKGGECKRIGIPLVLDEISKPSPPLISTQLVSDETPKPSNPLSPAKAKPKVVDDAEQ